MKDSQLCIRALSVPDKYIKVNNERFSTRALWVCDRL